MVTARKALAALSRLTPEAIRERLRELDGEQRSLRTLLRAAEHQEHARRQNVASGEEASAR